jgi:hypothetical protein
MHRFKGIMNNILRLQVDDYFLDALCGVSKILSEDLRKAKEVGKNNEEIATVESLYFQHYLSLRLLGARLNSDKIVETLIELPLLPLRICGPTDAENEFVLSYNGVNHLIDENSHPIFQERFALVNTVKCFAQSGSRVPQFFPM